MKKINISNNVYGLMILPLRVGNCGLSECVVKAGDEILVGDLIGKSNKLSQLNIYSSVSGRVVAVEDMLNTHNGLTKSVIIQSDEVQKYANRITLKENTLQNLVYNISLLGLMGYEERPLAETLDRMIKNECDSLGVIAFDEFNGYDLQEYLLQENIKNVMQGVNEISKLLKVKNIKIYLNKRNGENDKIKELILKNAKNTKNIEFLEIKTPKNKNNYDFFKKYIEKNNLQNVFIQTPETYLDIFEGLKNSKIKLSKLIYVGGSATKINNGYLEILNGTMIEDIVKMCGDLVFEEQTLEDMKADIGDLLDDLYDLKDKYKNEKDKDKKKELKTAYRIEKKKTDSEVWKYIKNQRANLMKTIRQIRINSVKFGEIFTDFSPIFEQTDSAIYFLNRSEC